MPEAHGMRRQGLPQTPSQTIGPFFGYALPFAGGPDVVPAWHPSAIRFHGSVLDGAGDGIPDALVEIWGADETGAPYRKRGSLARDGYTITGFGRVATDRDGSYSFTTVKPGSNRPGTAPFLLIAVFARGLTHHLFTRAYFDDEPVHNDSDRLLRKIDAARRATVIASSEGPASYRFDIRVQGEGETVFLDVDGDTDA